MKDFSVKKVDVSRQIKAIEAFEATAVKSAEETKGVVEKELQDLKRTLENIQGARAFEDLTVVCSVGLGMVYELRSRLTRYSTGRSHGRPAGDPGEGREDGFEPPMDATGLQGMVLSSPSERRSY